MPRSQRPLLLTTALIAAGIALAGCSAQPATGGDPAPDGAGQQTLSFGDAPDDLSPESVLSENADATTVNDDEWSEADAVDVALEGSTASAAAEGVEVDGSTVTITAAGVYRLSGDLDGRVVVEAPDDALVVLLLDDARIENADGPAIEARTGDDLAIFLAEGSSNRVSDAASYAEDAEARAAIHADMDLTISGTGALVVEGYGEDGVVSTDDLVVLSGSLTVSAADDALRGKDALVVEGGALVVEASSGDGLKSDQEDDPERGYVLVRGGTVDVTAGDDGIQAQTDVVVTGGEVAVSAVDDGVKGEAIASIGGGTVTVTESTEALEAAYVWIGGGEIDLTASDDGINASGAVDLAAGGATATEPDAEAERDAPGAGPGGAAGGGEFADTGERLEISGGRVTVDAGGDGLDSNGSLTVTGGEITVYGPTDSGNGALDANGALAVNGGTLIAFGAGGMEQTPGEESSQGWVVLSGALDAGQEARIVDASGATVATATAKKAAGAVIASSSSLVSGETYALVANGEELATAVAGEGGAGGFGPQGGPAGGAPGAMPEPGGGSGVPAPPGEQGAR